MTGQPHASLVGKSVVFEKRLAGDDIDRFAAVSGDDHPIHTDEAFARGAGLAGRIAQGALLVGLMAGASTKFFRDIDTPALSYGYDRLRFTGAVPLGTLLRVTYQIEAHEADTDKTTADVKVTDESGRLVAVAKHICKLLPPAVS